MSELWFQNGDLMSMLRQEVTVEDLQLSLRTVLVSISSSVVQTALKHHALTWDNSQGWTVPMEQPGHGHAFVQCFVFSIPYSIVCNIFESMGRMCAG